MKRNCCLNVQYSLTNYINVYYGSLLLQIPQLRKDLEKVSKYENNLNII